MEVRGHGGCPIFLLTPMLTQPADVAPWQKEFDKLWGELDKAGLRNVVVEGSPLWNDRMLFHHDEHMSEQGREIWTRMVIAKLQKDGLPDSCGRVNARSN